MSAVFYRNMKRNYPLAVKSEGMYIFDEEDSKVYFTSGGAEANETAIKLAWQYWCSKGQNNKLKIISREHSFHDKTCSALSMLDNKHRRRPMGDILQEWSRIKACYAYRYKKNSGNAQDYTLRFANRLKNIILVEGADTIAAFIAEPVVGTSLCVVAAKPGYFSRIREICTKHDILLISEVAITKRLMQSVMKNGLFCYPGRGSRQDTLGSNILLEPPFIVGGAHIEQLIEKLHSVFTEELDA